MAFLHRVRSFPKDADSRNPWRYVGPSGETLGYSLPRDDREAVYRFEKFGGPGVFVKYEEPRHGELGRSDWVRWHRKQAAAPVDTRPPAPFQEPPETPAPVERYATREVSATLPRAAYGLQSRFQR
ncbi:hypothetical protein AB4Y42_06080 [Paraburkholderia sp. EG286B]|uniref:hypothetical protein n=1 Tax=Paraburkholderia sp. EG286B TaxID=3237011 RepID=UPI0034D2B71A